MSPSANSTAAPVDSSYASASFASVFAFVSSFRSLVTSNIHEPKDLEDAIHCVGGSDGLRDLALLLLAAAANRLPAKKLSEDQWPRLCARLASSDCVDILKRLRIPTAVADSFDSFLEHNVAVRVDVLCWLCEVALVSNSSVKTMIDREIARSRSLPTSTSTSTSTQPLFLLRLQPFAEIAKQRYWVFGSKSRHLYLESTSQRTKGKFELLAQTPSDFARVADHLRTQRTQAHKALANRLLEEIVPFLEKQARKRARAEKALQRQAAAIANVHVYDTRTRKRQRINYNVDDSLASVDF